MYGLVNRAIEDMAVLAGGPGLWERIRLLAGLEEASFQSMTSYPDELTYRLVGAAAQVLELPAEEVLRRFGRHWIVYTGREGYGPLMTMAGSTLPAFLRNLDAMHARVAVTMPGLRPPSFVVTELADDLLAVEYRSTRKGLEPMVLGLLEGLAESLQTPAEVTMEPVQPGSPARFLVRHG